MINASAYAHKNRLCVIGVYQSPWGAIPFAHHHPIPGEVADGPINIGAEDLDPAIREAIDQSKGAIMQKVKAEGMTAAAGDLVQRARQGDQNAMAMLMMVRKSARRGNARAKRAYGLLTTYAKSHPPVAFGSAAAPKQLPMRAGASAPTDTRVASSLREAVTVKNPLHYSSAVTSLVPSIGKTPRDLVVGAVILANGPLLVNPRIEHLSTTFGSDAEKKAFDYGVIRSKNPTRIKLVMNQMLAGQPEEIREAMQVGCVVGMARAIQQVRMPNSRITDFSSMAGWELGE
jgi:hypothetical protein